MNSDDQSTKPIPIIQDWRDPKTVSSWIANRSGNNPQREQHLDILLTLLAAVQPEGSRILDLGCGDGLVAEMLLQRLPGSFIVGIDSSPPMLAEAERRLNTYPGRYSLSYGELAALEKANIAGPFDAAIGVQSIHHLDGHNKRALFRHVAALLRPGGLFLLSDRVMLSSAQLFPLQLALWNRNQQQNGNRPATEDFGYAAHLRALALRGDFPDTVEDQVRWLRVAGFGEATVFYQYIERAVFGGLKLELGPRSTPLPDDQSGNRMTLNEEQPGP